MRNLTTTIPLSHFSNIIKNKLIKVYYALFLNKLNYNALQQS